MKHATAKEKDKATATDPVCGMEIDGKPAATAQYQGQKYQFCSQDCKEQFEEDPEQYATTAA